MDKPTPVSEAAARLCEDISAISGTNVGMAADIRTVLDALDARDRLIYSAVVAGFTAASSYAPDLSAIAKQVIAAAPSAPAEREWPLCTCGHHKKAHSDAVGCFVMPAGAKDVNENCPCTYYQPAAPASPEPSVTPKQLADALWQAYYHNDLDDLASDIHFHTIDGNDSPIFHETARAIIRRLVAHET